MAQLINEAKRMQFLAGIINESQLNEEKVGSIDVNTVKQMINKPEVQKMADTLEDNPDAAKKLAAALSDPKALAILSGDSIDENERTFSPKERILRFLKYAGVGSVAGTLLLPMTLITATATGPAILAMLAAGAIAGALIGSGVGAIATTGFKRELPFEEAEGQEDDIKTQIAQVLAFGKK
jgi:hypothetical protein